ncbi:MAG: hypothetical protein Nkreftii_001456 [Candidatus Nitrospira kreftii]|uniref:Uncharacterized protein n=1 Tax=Candidatus Nitrospira kreftii TaxID=2652173 RepID=A0A7S8FDA6_9BACT|nr:MAG: hypothetical protein Nkreftii_001456 [Candidatus Nitrospira kreftii]
MIVAYRFGRRSVWPEGLGHQIGSSLVEMQKNVDQLQKHIHALKQTEDKLSSLSPTSGGMGGAMDTLLNKGK